jgi:lysophospholipase L1-like esterase
MLSKFNTRLHASLAALTLALLGGCGGGTSQIDPFVPNRIVSFGDELSAIRQDGHKYTVNALNADGQTVDCKSSPVWNQKLAANFGFVFPQCNPDGVAIPQGILYASAGAKVADVSTQVDNFLGTDNFGPKTLVTVMVGMNDILELYNQFPAQSRDDLIAQAKVRGTQLAQVVNKIAKANGRVLISTVYDLGESPFGLNERDTHPDIDRVVLLGDLTVAFNTAMRLALLDDGRLIGLVLADETVQQAVKFPTAFGLADNTRAACRPEVASLSCTSNTLVPDATATTWLWATPKFLSPKAHDMIGAIAITRARNNPF